MKDKPVQVDFVYGGRASSPGLFNKILSVNGDMGALRPWRTNDGRKSFVTLTRNGQQVNVPVDNATTTLRKDEWLAMDAAVVRAALPRLRMVADLQGSGLTYGIPNGMGKTVLQYERMSDINDASISMDGLRLGADDRFEFDSVLLPLPIIHKDWQISARQLLVSRNGSTPFDTSMAEAAARKVAEYAEKLTIGRLATYAYANGIIYGMTNYPGRISKTITAPDATGWTGATLLGEILAMRQLSYDANHFGPWMLYFSLAWDEYLDNDFSSLYPGVTVRERLLKLNGISGIRTLDYLSGFDCVLLEMSSETIRLVVGLGITTLEWDEIGGLLKNYKIMTIMVPQLRADMNGNTGIVHGSTT